MANNTYSPNSSWANRKAKQDFKRRYNAMSNDERKEFDKNVSNVGSIIGGIIFLVFLFIVILRALLS